MHDNATVSLATGCMNRASSLRQALPTWLECSELDEIVIVDWNSREPVYNEFHTEFGDPRIRFVRVSDQPFWRIAHCRNVEILSSRFENLLITDSDVLLKPEFIVRHPLTDKQTYWNFDWRNSPFDEGPYYKFAPLGGTVYSKRENFMRLKGYNEYLTLYGFDDEDLYKRMDEIGLVHRNLNREMMQHIPHDNVSRLAHVDPTELGGKDLLASVEHNKRLSEEHPWSSDSEHMTEWVMERVDERLTICRPQNGMGVKL